MEEPTDTTRKTIQMAKVIDVGLLPEDDPIFSGLWIMHSRQSSPRLTPDERRAMETPVTDEPKKSPKPLKNKKRQGKLMRRRRA